MLPFAALTLRRFLRPWWRAAGVVGAAALALAQAAPPAAEPAAAPPLEEIKGELKALKGGNNPDLSGLSSGPKLSVPGFTAPKDDSGPPAAPLERPETRENKKPTNANWLLDAMALQTKAGSDKDPKAMGQGEKNRLSVVDPSDPAYLLKFYLAQKPENQTAEPAAARLKEPTDFGQTETGTLDGFLRTWISPGDQAPLRPGDASSTGYPGAWSAPATGPATVPKMPARRVDAPNPFLEALRSDLPASDQTGPVPSDRRPFALPAANPPSRSPSPAAIPPPAPGDAPTSATRKPPPNPTDEKKYFPQLDRF
ncbi:MAG: hypothetical protein WC485_07185 [Opitutaceae bacterium]